MEPSPAAGFRGGAAGRCAGGQAHAVSARGGARRRAGGGGGAAAAALTARCWCPLEPRLALLLRITVEEKNKAGRTFQLHASRPWKSARWSSRLSGRRICRSLPDSSTQYSPGRICKCSRTSSFVSSEPLQGNPRALPHSARPSTDLEVVRGGHGHAVGARVVHHQAGARRCSRDHDQRKQARSELSRAPLNWGVARHLLALGPARALPQLQRPARAPGVGSVRSLPKKSALSHTGPTMSNTCGRERVHTHARFVVMAARANDASCCSSGRRAAERQTSAPPKQGTPPTCLGAELGAVSSMCW